MGEEGKGREEGRGKIEEEEGEDDGDDKDDEGERCGVGQFVVRGVLALCLLCIHYTWLRGFLWSGFFSLTISPVCLPEAVPVLIA